jgi:glutathione-independent formaldehyde dehydrogenase
MQWPDGTALPNAAIVKVLTSAVCGSDLHVYRGRAPAQEGLVLGHEITGQVVEIGSAVQFVKVGDLVSVPFHIGCGTCSNCKSMKTGVCQGTNKEAGQAGIYGYSMGGGWNGGQAEYVMCPFPDFNLLRFPENMLDMVKSKWLDLSMLADAFTTGFHGAVSAGVKTGSTVLVVGCGPVGISAILGAQLLGAAVIAACDVIPERLSQASALGAKVLNLREVEFTDLPDKWLELTGHREFECCVDAVGFEAAGVGKSVGTNVPQAPFDICSHSCLPGGKINLDGAYFEMDPKGADTMATMGIYHLRLGHSWVKAHEFTMGQCPVSRYNEHLMKTILHHDVHVARSLNVKVVSLDSAQQTYEEFNKGVPHKFVFDPHGVIKQGKLTI